MIYIKGDNHKVQSFIKIKLHSTIMVKKILIQTLIFDKSKFKNKTKVREWIKKNNFIIMKGKKKAIDEKENTYRVRQREPSIFDKKTFRTFDISKNIQAVGGFLKPKIK